MSAPARRNQDSSPRRIATGFMQPLTFSGMPPASKSDSEHGAPLMRAERLTRCGDTSGQGREGDAGVKIGATLHDGSWLFQTTGIFSERGLRQGAGSVDAEGLFHVGVPLTDISVVGEGVESFIGTGPVAVSEKH